MMTIIEIESVTNCCNSYDLLSRRYTFSLYDEELVLHHILRTYNVIKWSHSEHSRLCFAFN